MPKIALALNTTTGVLELAIAQVNPLIYLKHDQWQLDRELSVEIHNCLADFIRGYVWSDLAFVAIASGVGSFTGTRIGIVLARTLGEQLTIPVYALSCKDIEAFSQTLEDSLGQRLKINNLIKIGHTRWLKGDYPDWSQSLPLYS